MSPSSPATSIASASTLARSAAWPPTTTVCSFMRSPPAPSRCVPAAASIRSTICSTVRRRRLFLWHRGSISSPSTPVSSTIASSSLFIAASCTQLRTDARPPSASASSSVSAASSNSTGVRYVASTLVSCCRRAASLLLRASAAAFRTASRALMTARAASWAPAACSVSIQLACLFVVTSGPFLPLVRTVKLRCGLALSARLCEPSSDLSGPVGSAAGCRNRGSRVLVERVRRVHFHRRILATGANPLWSTDRVCSGACSCAGRTPNTSCPSGSKNLDVASQNRGHWRILLTFQNWLIPHVTVFAWNTRTGYQWLRSISAIDNGAFS